MTATLTTTTKAGGTCDCCGRDLTKVYILSNGRELGRKCAAKALGWASSAVEREIKRLEFVARRDEQRRREGWTVERFMVEYREALLPAKYATREEQAEDAYRKLWRL